MSVAFTILTTHNLVYVRFAESVTVAETRDAFDAYKAHPDAHPGQSQLVDLTEVCDYERDFTRIMSLQAHQADLFMEARDPIHLIFVAPNALTQSMAMAAIRSWQNLSGVIPMVLPSLAQALAILSMTPADLDDTKESVD